MRMNLNQAAAPAELTTQVLIIGAGPIGLLLANLLGQKSIPVLVVDRRTDPLESSMAIGVTPPSLEILKALGLDSTFIRAGVPVRFAEVIETRQLLGRLDFAGIESAYQFFLSIPQARTVEVLRHHLVQFPSVTVRTGLEFTGLESHDGHVRVQLRETATGREIAAHTRFVAGCDGHRSRVRSAIGLPVVEREYPQRFIMADFTDQSGLGNEARLFFTPEASVESFPLPGGWRRWIVQANRQGEEPPADFLVRKVRELAGFELGGQPVRFLSTFGARRMLVEKYFRGRVLLAGDAAHVMSSIGGQGMNTGFADAELLAKALEQALKNPEEAAKIFAAYDRIRRRAFSVAADRAERGMWLGTLQGRLGSWFRKHLIRDLLFSPLLRSKLAPHFAMLTIPWCNLNRLPLELLSQF